MRLPFLLNGLCPLLSHGCQRHINWQRPQKDAAQPQMFDVPKERDAPHLFASHLTRKLHYQPMASPHRHRSIALTRSCILVCTKRSMLELELSLELWDNIALQTSRRFPLLLAMQTTAPFTVYKIRVFAIQVFIQEENIERSKCFGDWPFWPVDLGRGHPFCLSDCKQKEAVSANQEINDQHVIFSFLQ